MDWLNFFTANLQTAFGPFVSVYLTQQHWSQGDIGLALAAGYAAGMAAQVPAGALVDALRRKALAAGGAIVAIIAGALLLAAFPTMLPVLAAEVSHAFASCMLGPAIASISLALVARDGGQMGERLGRNARFASIGNGSAAAAMAAAGDAWGARSVFLLGAALAVPGLVALRQVADIEAPPATGRTSGPLRGLAALLGDRRVLWFGACCAAFHLSNAAMLPLAASAATRGLDNAASLVIGACIVGPQLIVAVISPLVGRLAERFGRRPVLMAGMAALVLRALGLAGIVHGDTVPGWPLMAVQTLDGVSAATFGVLLPLVAADLAQAAGRFNLCMGLLGLAIGAAAAASTYAGGALADFSLAAAFMTLAAIGVAGFALAWGMAETGSFDPKTRKTPELNEAKVI